MRYEKNYGPAQAFIEKYKANHIDRLPWVVAMANIRSRCAGYSKRDQETYLGIGVSVSAKELRTLFYRDKAYLMNQPSVDRKDPDDDYSLDNVKWIEFDANRKKRAMNHPERQEAYRLGKKLITDFFDDKKWRPNTRRSFLRRLLVELKIPENFRNRQTID